MKQISGTLSLILFFQLSFAQVQVIYGDVVSYEMNGLIKVQHLLTCL